MPGWGISRICYPNANVIDPSYYALEALSGVNPPNFVDGRVVVPPSFAWGSRVSNNNPNYAPPNTPFPGFLNINATDDISISLTKVCRPAYDQERLLQHPQLQGAAARRLERDHHLRERQQQPHRLDVRVCQRGPGYLQPVHAGVEVRRGVVRLQQHRGLHPGQLEGDEQSDAGLRRALRTPAAAVRRQGTGLQFPAREMGGGPGASAVPRGLPEQRQPVRGRQPPGHEPADRPAPRDRARMSRLVRSCRTPAIR